MVRALLIEIKDWRTGERAYGINPKDPKLIALGGSLWQSLDYENKGDWEVRLVLDDRKLDYKGEIVLDTGEIVYYATDIPKDAVIVDINGVVPLTSAEEINKVLDHLPEKIRGDIARVRAWALKHNITLQSVDEERKEMAKRADKGWKMTAKKRGKPLEHIVAGELNYAFMKKVYESGCPWAYKLDIPKV